MTQSCDESFGCMQVVEEVVFDSPHSDVRHQVSQVRGKPAGNFIKVVGCMENVALGQAAFSANKKAFLEKEMPHMDWASKLRRKCPGLYDTDEQLYKLFCGGEVHVMDMIKRITACRTIVKKVRLWAEGLLAALSVIHAALPPGTNPLGGPDLPEVALYIMCNAGPELYTHAHLMRIFTLDYMGEDLQDFTLPQELGAFRDTHDQYTWDAEKRCVYPQMMLNYLLDGLDLIAAFGAEEEALTPAPASPGESPGLVLTDSSARWVKDAPPAAPAPAEPESPPAAVVVMGGEGVLPVALQENLTKVACAIEDKKTEALAEAFSPRGAQRAAEDMSLDDEPRTLEERQEDERQEAAQKARALAEAKERGRAKGIAAFKAKAPPFPSSSPLSPPPPVHFLLFPYDAPPPYRLLLMPRPRPRLMPWLRWRLRPRQSVSRHSGRMWCLYRLHSVAKLQHLKFHRTQLCVVVGRRWEPC